MKNNFWIVRFCCLLYVLPYIQSNRILNMDELSTCGGVFEVFESPVFINARSNSPPNQPPTYCKIILETTSRDGAYRLEIIIKSVAIKDSSFVLTIYEGKGETNTLRLIGASSKSTDIIYTKSNSATFILTRPNDLISSENDFSLEVKGYRDPDEPVPVYGGSRLSPGAIVGIILAILLLIGFGVLLCYLYNTGAFSKKVIYTSKQSMVGSKESLQKTSSISSLSSRKGYSGKEDKAFASAFLSSVTGNLSSNGNISSSSSAGRGRGAALPKLPPSRAEVRTIHDKDGYEEPINTRRYGKGSSVTFDTRQQDPHYFHRSYSSSSQNGERSSKSSLAKSKYGPPDRSSGHSNASYAEIKDLPNLRTNDPESKFNKAQGNQILSAPSSEHQRPSKKSSESPRSSLRSSSRDTGNGLISEGSSQASIQKDSNAKSQRASLLKEINSFDSSSNLRRTSSISEANKKEKVRPVEDMYSTVKKKPNLSSSGTPEGSSTKTGHQNNGFQDDGSNFTTVPEAKITMSSNMAKERERKKSISKDFDLSKTESKQTSIDDDEDENDREVRRIHANKKALNDEEYSSNESYGSKETHIHPDEPTMMTNPLINNNYLKHSVDDPSIQKTSSNNQDLPNKKTDPRIPQNRSKNPNLESNGDRSSNHPHYGIPELVEQTPQEHSENNYGFPSAFNAILSRTVRPDPNKTIEYGYHTQTNDSNESVSGKAAWYIESEPTKSGPIKTSAFFLQTSHPSQKNESVYVNEPHPNGHPMTSNGNQFGPEHTSTPVSTFQPGGPISKPKAKPRNRSSTSNNPKDRFPLSIPRGEQGLSKATPGQKSAVVKSGFDPNTGCQTTQVLWTDSLPDPTDPDPELDNPCITRKTINRITTRSTYGNLPENPFPLLNQIQMESNEPSFLSPSVVSRSHMLVPSSEIVSEIPHPEEMSFYTQPSKTPVIHDGNKKHYNIKDRITIA